MSLGDRVPREALPSPLGAVERLLEQAKADVHTLLDTNRHLVIALRDRGFPVEYLLAPDEGHGFQRPVTNMAMYMATEFMYQQLHGNNAAAIDDPLTGNRFMNDLATYEIFWHFLYLTVFHGAELTDDGKYSKKGERVTPQLFMKLLDERRDTVKELFKKLNQKYEETDAELVLQILKRQVVDDTGDELPIPNQPFGFGKLIRAQAAGAFASLQERGSRVARIRLEEV